MKKSKGPREEQKGCVCPYCEGEVAISDVPFCQPCGVTLRYCVCCHMAVEKEAEVCPQCGGKLESK